MPEGDWYADGNRVWVRTDRPGHALVMAEVVYPWHPGEASVREATALTLAAAKDMQAALEALVAGWDSRPGIERDYRDEQVDAARAALAKANGGP